MRCEDITDDELVAIASEEVPEPPEELANHIAGCTACARRLLETDRLIRLVQQLPHKALLPEVLFIPPWQQVSEPLPDELEIQLLAISARTGEIPSAATTSPVPEPLDLRPASFSAKSALSRQGEGAQDGAQASQAKQATFKPMLPIWRGFIPPRYAGILAIFLVVLALPYLFIVGTREPASDPSPDFNTRGVEGGLGQAVTLTGTVIMKDSNNRSVTLAQLFSAGEIGQCPTGCTVHLALEASGSGYLSVWMSSDSVSDSSATGPRVLGQMQLLHQAEVSSRSMTRYAVEPVVLPPGEPVAGGAPVNESSGVVNFVAILSLQAPPSANQAEWVHQYLKSSKEGQMFSRIACSARP